METINISPYQGFFKNTSNLDHEPRFDDTSLLDVMIEFATSFFKNEAPKHNPTPIQAQQITPPQKSTAISAAPTKPKKAEPTFEEKRLQQAQATIAKIKNPRNRSLALQELARLTSEPEAALRTINLLAKRG